MERKHIDISNRHKLSSGKIIQWVKSIPAKNFIFMESGGVTLALTENHYYLDQKKDKVCYQFMKCDNASWDHSYDIYAELYPGVFFYCSICTDTHTSIDGQFLTRIFESVENCKKNNEQDIEKLRKSLIRSN